jgi:hypothetical protein
MESSTPSIPKIIFIVPYRNRAPHLVHFKIYMKYILINIPENDYEIYFISQEDFRPFNRGAMKNIGFLVMKNKYPNDYKNITFVFNDIDNMPFEKDLLDYNTCQGVIKHFYGFEWTLGGIVSFNGYDFEKVNGYPNYWAWGQEDNDIHTRVKQSNLKIDRSSFYKFDDSRIININNKASRVFSKEQIFRAGPKNTEGLTDITNLEYNITNDMVHVTNFTTRVNPLNDNYYEFDPTTKSKPEFDSRYKPPNAINSPEELARKGLLHVGKPYSNFRGIGMKLF